MSVPTAKLYLSARVGRPAEVRRLGPASGVLTSVNTLLERITGIWDDVDAKNIRISWKDSDSDMVIIETDVELEEAMKHTVDDILQLYIKDMAQAPDKPEPTRHRHRRHHGWHGPHGYGFHRRMAGGGPLFGFRRRMCKWGMPPWMMADAQMADGDEAQNVENEEASPETAAENAGYFHPGGGPCRRGFHRMMAGGGPPCGFHRYMPPWMMADAEMADSDEAQNVENEEASPEMPTENSGRRHRGRGPCGRGFRKMMAGGYPPRGFHRNMHPCGIPPWVLAHMQMADGDDAQNAEKDDAEAGPSAEPSAEGQEQRTTGGTGETNVESDNIPGDGSKKPSTSGTQKEKSTPTTATKQCPVWWGRAAREWGYGWPSQGEAWETGYSSDDPLAMMESDDTLEEEEEAAEAQEDTEKSAGEGEQDCDMFAEGMRGRKGRGWGRAGCRRGGGRGWGGLGRRWGGGMGCGRKGMGFGRGRPGGRWGDMMGGGTCMGRGKAFRGETTKGMGCGDEMSGDGMMAERMFNRMMRRRMMGWMNRSCPWKYGKMMGCCPRRACTRGDVARCPRFSTGFPHMRRQRMLVRMLSRRIRRLRAQCQRFRAVRDYRRMKMQTEMEDTSDEDVTSTSEEEMPDDVREFLTRRHWGVGRHHGRHGWRRHRMASHKRHEDDMPCHS